MRRLVVAVWVATLSFVLLFLGFITNAWGVQPFSTALLIGSPLPLLLREAGLAHRSRHPLGGPHILYDDFLGRGPLPEFIRQTFGEYHDMIARNLPGPVDRFTLVAIDRPFGKRFPRGKPSEEILAITYRVPTLMARAFVREHDLPRQPLVALRSEAWERRLHTGAMPNREVERN